MMPDPPARSAVRYPGRALAALAVYAVLGPPIGGIAVMAALRMHQLVFAYGMVAAEALLQLMVVVGVWSYVFGGLPALLTGAYLGIRTWLSGRHGYLEVLITALVMCVAVALWFVFRIEPATTSAMLIALLPPGLFAALICRALLGLLGVVPAPSPAAPKS